VRDKTVDLLDYTLIHPSGQAITIPLFVDRERNGHNLVVELAKICGVELGEHADMAPNFEGKVAEFHLVKNERGFMEFDDVRPVRVKDKI
jgi:hypothetical protein